MRIYLWRRLAQRLANPVSRAELRQRRKLAGFAKLEELEARDVPSITIHPGYVLETPQHGVKPDQGGGIVGYTPAQVSAGYGFSQISDTGKGETIAIVDAYNDPNVAPDLTTFDTQFGLPAASLSVVNQSGGSKLPAGNTGWAEEIALDVEWAHAMAPAANILLVEATNASMQNLGAAVEFAASQKGVAVVSMSWGGSEYSTETSYDHYFEPPSSNPDVVFIAASGDSGPPAEYPASSPYVMGIGGTTLSLSSSGAWESETAWSDSTGGYSFIEPEPSWQDNDGITQTGPLTYRTAPDVAYDANPSTGFAVYNSYSFSKSEAWEEFGGTSCGAPQWSAIIADTDQSRAAAGEANLDNAVLMPLIYSATSSSSSVYHDITSGSNGEYNAGPGYDLVTGWGSPVVNNLVPYLTGNPNGVTHFSITPSSGSETSGTPFGITVEALNSSNQVVTNFTGTVTFTSTGPGDQLEVGSTWENLSGATYAFTAGNDGEATFNLNLGASVSSDTVTVADGSLTGSATYSISNGVTHFSIAPASGSETAGTPFPITVEALNSSNQVVTNFIGTVTFTSTGTGDQIESGSTWSTLSGATYMFTSSNAGEATFNLNLGSTGSDTVTVADGSLTGSATYTVSTPYFSLGSLSPSPIYAGVPETFTLTAYLAGGTLDSSYNGTVKFTSTYPSSTQFSISSFSDGSATVTVTFDKAVSGQTITATDSVNSAMTGSESNLTVLPGAPTQLLFLQEPTNALVNATIAPAITVEELDRYGNQVTTDSSSSVTLSFASNTTGATLGGTLTETVVNGIATFGNISVNTLGSYTLLATDTLAGNLTPKPPTFTLTTTSTSFTISSANTKVIENFQNGLNDYYYFGSNYPEVGTSTAAAHPGTATYGMYDEGDNNWYFRQDSGALIAPGDTVTTWIDFSGSASGSAYFGFGTNALNPNYMGTYSVVLAPNTGQFLIQGNPNFDYYNTLAAANQSYSANTWYFVQIEWSTTGNVIANLYASNGTTLLNSIEAHDVSTLAGTFAFRATSGTKYFSTVSLTTGVNNFVTPPSSPTGGTHTATPTAPSHPTLPPNTFLPWLLGGIELEPNSSHRGETLAPAIDYPGTAAGEEWFW